MLINILSEDGKAEVFINPDYITNSDRIDLTNKKETVIVHLVNGNRVEMTNEQFNKIISFLNRN
jgi:hypothetical protein